jgi:hypothetical protein
VMRHVRGRLILRRRLLRFWGFRFRVISMGSRSGRLLRTGKNLTGELTVTGNGDRKNKVN